MLHLHFRASQAVNITTRCHVTHIFIANINTNHNHSASSDYKQGKIRASNSVQSSVDGFWQWTSLDSQTFVTEQHHYVAGRLCDVSVNMLV